MNSYNEKNLTGTIINYYIHCKRQCWLFANRINLEDNSELVKIGRAIHEAKNTEEIEIDNIKIDKISAEYLTEIKKSGADTEACKYQILFYLEKLKQKGIERKGKLEIVEKKKGINKIQFFELTDTENKNLQTVKEKTIELINQKEIPPFTFSPKCNKCAYFTYCNI